MKKKQSREISIFNLSMLDVIFSALGAILILFMITIEHTSKTEADIEKAHEALKKANMDIDDLTATLEKLAQLDQENEELKKKIKKLKRRARGVSMGMCRVPIGTEVNLNFFDHGQVDGDRVALMWNGEQIETDLNLPGPPGVNRKVIVDDVDNVLDITALNEGFVSPNTDKIVVTPCINGQPRDFEWEMSTQEVRSLSIEGL